MSVEVITKDDLQAFRTDLLNDIKQLLTAAPERPVEWLKSSELRKLLPVSVNTIRNLRISGDIPYSKIGGTYYYKYRDLIKRLEKGVPKSI
jgi:hypothetical protein